MNAHQRRGILLLAAGLVVAIVSLGGVFSPSSAQAAPAGAASGLYAYDQQCTASGDVRVSFAWNPSGWGSQWFDVTGASSFEYGYSNAGPLSQYTDSYTWTLSDNSAYKARVATWTAYGWRTSDTYSFSTISCGPDFTSPYNNQSTTYADLVNVSWQPGVGNYFFCVDAALNYTDLVSVSGSWSNACTSSTSINLTHLQCGTEYLYRVWATGTGSGYSPIGEFDSQPCDFAPPINLDAEVNVDEDVVFTWDAVDPAFWFCVDVAETESDLVNFDDWWNYCNGAAEQALGFNEHFECGDTYYFRVFGHAGSNGNGYSDTASFVYDPAGCP